MNQKIFPPEQARKLYDRIGRLQDTQVFYEKSAISFLIAHGSFEKAGAVFELGFGTGRLAEELLSRHLPETCTYSGMDISGTMEEIAKWRLRPWQSRVELQVADCTKGLAFRKGAFDRFISTYVFDLLSTEDTVYVLSEAHRILKPGGLFCNISLTYGAKIPGRIITWLWRIIYALEPRLVGGCRPVRILDRLATKDWLIKYTASIQTFGITSEVLIAEAR